ncbi:mechanosensitive ion channel family protein [Clostridium bornimense]|uniref:mechanosensitive ion channel family protein n=1 Tax=Clostridium bornimense TaxID=1216932 RepID=UPI001C1154FC|nr:mechanosensitive ion channel family protein [Clostridium bornimense]MBU5315265.1 mechanosensitive ion channel family protein [Clostridium bornimense]
MMDIIDFLFSRENINILISILILIVSLALSKFVVKLVLKIILKFPSRSRLGIKEKVVSAIEKPLIFIVLVFGVFVALYIFPFTFDYIKRNIFNKVYISINICIFVWAGQNLCDVNSIILERAEGIFNFNLDKGASVLISRLMKLIVLIIGATLILQTWNYDISVVVASFGVFSAVIALAAKDYLTNVFSGLIIIADRPFSIGDYIETDFGVGIVEDISFRTTKIRSFDKAIITVPNSKLSSNPVINYSRRDSRRATFTVGISYETEISKITIVVDKIRDMLYKSKEVDNDSIICHFDSFGDSSLNIFLNFYINKSEWVEYLAEKEKINIAIMKILESEGVEIAFPSQTIYISDPSKNTEK